jgi:hypothetical protein
LISSSTKLAILEKGFQNQADSELQVADAKHNTGNQARASAKAFDTGFSKDTFWELSSKTLWQYYKGGESWSQLGRITGGYICVRRARDLGWTATSFLTGVVFEFGNRAFTAVGVSIPIPPIPGL